MCIFFFQIFLNLQWLCVSYSKKKLRHLLEIIYQSLERCWGTFFYVIVYILVCDCPIVLYGERYFKLRLQSFLENQRKQCSRVLHIKRVVVLSVLGIPSLATGKLPDFISLFQYHWLFWCSADWFVRFSCNPNRTLKSFLIFLGLSSRVCLFSSSWQDSAPPVPALVGTWQPQWKAAGRTVLKNEVNNLSEHLWASSLFKSDPPPPSTHPLSVSSHLSIFFFFIHPHRLKGELLIFS